MKLPIFEAPEIYKGPYVAGIVADRRKAYFFRFHYKHDHDMLEKSLAMYDKKPGMNIIGVFCSANNFLADHIRSCTDQLRTTEDISDFLQELEIEKAAANNFLHDITK